MATEKEKVMSMAENKEYCIKLRNCSGIGEFRGPDCEDFLRIFIEVSNTEIITNAAYEVNEGASHTVRACAAVVVGLLKDKPVLEGYTISRKMIEAQLSNNGMMNQEDIHCAIMAELSLKRAIIDYASKKKNSNK